MATWYFMLILVLLMPLFMTGFGRVFMTNPPKDINTSFGPHDGIHHPGASIGSYAFCGSSYRKCIEETL